MFKLVGGFVSVLCLLAAAWLLWQSPAFPERLPETLATWAQSWFALFRNPIAAGAMLGLCILFAVAAASVTELLLGLVFSLASATVSILCVIGILGSQSPGFADAVITFLK